MTTPAVGDFFYDEYGKIEIKTVTKNYLVVRRSGKVPFCMGFSEWDRRKRTSDAVDRKNTAGPDHVPGRGR